MAMFGEAVFSLVSKEEAPTVVGVFREAAPDHEVCMASVEERGARLK
jgi:hypothetical protein